MSNWRSLDPLPAARYNLAVASHRSFVYVAGGATNFAQTSLPLSVLKSRIDPDGVAGGNSAWTSCAPDLTVGKVGASMVVLQNQLILLGGRGATNLGVDLLPAQDVWIGKLDSDGNVPRWKQVVGALPAPMLDMGVVVKDNYIYLLGGNSVKSTLTFKTQSATGNYTVGQIITGQTSGATGTIMADTDGGTTGTLKVKLITGTFTAGEAAIDALGGSALVGVQAPAAATSFFLDYDTQTVNFTVGQLLTGGSSGATGTISADTDNGATGTLTLTGVSGIFTSGETITSAVAGSGKVAAGTAKYKTVTYTAQTANFTLGGIITGATSGATGVLSSQTDAGTTGTLILTGVVGVFQDSELLTDSLGGSALADGVASISATALDTMYRARVESSGDLGAFVALPGAIPVTGDLNGACAVVGNHILITNATETYVAHIGLDGIGPWTTLTSGFSKISHRMIRINGNKLIAVGGYNGSTTVATSYHAEIDSDGNAIPAVWEQTQTLPTNINDSGGIAARRRFGLTRIGNRLILVGGVDTNNLVCTSVLSVSLDPHGTIGGV